MHIFYVDFGHESVSNVFSFDSSYKERNEQSFHCFNNVGKTNCTYEAIGRGNLVFREFSSLPSPYTANSSFQEADRCVI